MRALAISSTQPAAHRRDTAITMIPAMVTTPTCQRGYRHLPPTLPRQRRDRTVLNLAGRVETWVAPACIALMSSGGRGLMPKRLLGSRIMCRSIKTLFNFDPPATEEEVRAAALQFVRKLSGFNTPSKANEAAFERAITDVAAVARTLLASLVTSAEPRDRAVEAERARARAAERFGGA